MHWAAKQIEDEEIIEVLANAECDVSVHGEQQKTAFDVALEEYSLKILTPLAKAGVDVDAKHSSRNTNT